MHMNFKSLLRAFGSSGSGVPPIRNVPAPQTATDTDTLTNAQMLGEILTVTPTSAAALTFRTGTQLDSAFSGLLVVGDSFDLAVHNLATGSGRDITMTASTGITTVGDMVVDAQDADGNNAVGVFMYRRSAADTIVVYRAG